MSKLTLNNISRLCFAQFVEKNKNKVNRVDRRNVLEMNGELYSFSVVENQLLNVDNFMMIVLGLSAITLKQIRHTLLILKICM